MISSTLDHLVVTAPTLGGGRDELAAALGVGLRPGGEHPLMGTHNVLLRLGEAAYLEVLAVNPAATRPRRTRWFDLDRLTSGSPARLRGWVVRTGDLEAAAARSPEPLGVAEAASRGDFHWRITIPAEGVTALEGVGPMLIQWEGAAHPAARLPDDGCSLLELEVRHPRPDSVRALLEAIGFEGPVKVLATPAGAAPSLHARIGTPHGVRELEGV